MNAIEHFEHQTTIKDVKTRVLEKIKTNDLAAVEILDYDNRFAADFKRLNEEWLEKYFWIEPYDNQVLSNPQEEIVDKGGLIFFAQLNGEIVGTVALLKIAENSYELSKMAVNEKYQGKKIGQKLMQHCITTAKAMKLDSLFLFSNTKLIA